MSWLEARKGGIRLRLNRKLAIVQDMDGAARLKTARDVLGNLNRIANQAKAA